LNNSWKSKIAIALLLISLLAQTPTVRGQTAAHLTVAVTGQNVVAGFNGTVTVSILNNWVGYGNIYNAIYDVDIAISLPSPLTMYGDNHWHFDSLLYGQTVTITFGVYAPFTSSSSSVSVPNSYAGTITATYKQLGDTTYTQESHSIAINVSGWINLIIYGIQALPSTITPGGNTTISGNLLNGGNLAAYNANVTVVSDAISPECQNPLCSEYIGEVDPNIPRPFSFLVVFKPNVPVGNLSITIIVSAIDQSRPGMPFRGQQTTHIQISRAQQLSESQRQARGPTGPLAIILAILRYIYDIFFGSTVLHAVGIMVTHSYLNCEKATKLPVK
jgi:hypothetical protein